MVSNKAIRQALYQALNVAPVTTKLAGGSAGIFHEVAASGAQFPLVVFNRQSETSFHTFASSAYDDQLWQVKAIDRSGSASSAEDIDKAIRDILDYGSLTISGGTQLFLSRESGVAYTETDGDQIYRHVGGIYRLAVS